MEVLTEIDRFVLPPRGTSRPEDFDPIAHLIVDDPEDDDGVPDDEKLPDPIFQRSVPNLEKHWLETAPSANQYVDLIIKTFKTGLERIKCFERWSKHEQLQPYRD